MAWIRVIEAPDAQGDLRAVYDDVVGSRGKVSSILSVHSLHPASMKAHMDLYMTIMFGPSELTREEREMIAVVVSSADQCPYCIQHHAAALDHYWRDPGKLERFLSDYRSIDLSPRMTSALDYAHKLTTDPASVDEADVERLRSEGFSDGSILTVNLIVSYFNFVNRIALGLGVEAHPDEVTGYKY